MLSAGDVINGYRIDGVLGRGGMGVVYEAVQLSLERRVALKVLSSDLSHDEDFRERFRREALVQGRFSHPHIVTVHDFGEVDGDLYLVMRLVDGMNLKQLLRNDAAPPDRVLGILSQIADALDTAHRAGLVHRDVKPQNILIENGDRAYLADFGLTRLAADTGFTRSGQFVGTVQYIAPEQIRGLPTTAAADIYSLAAVLYECLTGSVPFKKDNDVAVLYSHANEPPPRPTDVRPELPEALNSVIERGMAKEPRDRPSAAVELIHDAQEALAPTVVPPPPRKRAAASSRPPSEPPVSAAATGAKTAPPDVAPVSMPERRAPTRPKRVSSPGSRTPYRIGVAAVLVALAAVGGVIVARATVAGSVVSRTASSAQVGLRYSYPWVRTSSVVSVPGLAVSGPVSLREPGDGLMLVAGVSRVPDPTLLPGTLRSELVGPIAATDRVRLGAMQALRYRNVSIRSDGHHLMLFAVPIAGGAAVVVCGRSAPFTPSDENSCETIASTLVLHAAKPLPVAPNPAYAHAISTAVTKLDDAHTTLLSALRTARRPSAQASALSAFSTPCDRAASDFKASPAGPQEEAIETRIATAATAVCASYAQAESAARADDGARYAAAQTAAAAGERELDTAVASLRSIGYQV